MVSSNGASGHRGLSSPVLIEGLTFSPEEMISFETVPTAILSRQGASLKGSTLIVSLPGKLAAIDVSAAMPAIPYGLELSGAGKLETDPEQIVGFCPGLAG